MFVKRSAAATMDGRGQDVSPVATEGEGRVEAFQQAAEARPDREGEAGPGLQIVFQVPEVGRQGVGVRVPVLAALAETAGDDHVEPRREVPADGGHRPRLFERDGVHRVQAGSPA